MARPSIGVFLVGIVSEAWEAHALREEARYRDGLERLPEETDGRQKHLVRLAMAAGGAGLARLMQRRSAEAAEWFGRSAERYRESFPHAPPGSWGRLIGAVKARILAGDWGEAGADAAWALEQGPAESASPIARYAGALAALVLGRDAEAAPLARSLQAESDETFPRAVADALAALARLEPELYVDAVKRVLRSFDDRDAYLDDIPVADTVIVLEILAERRGLAAGLRSPLLPS